MAGERTSRSVIDTGRDNEHVLKLLLAETQRTNQLLETMCIALGATVPERFEVEFEKRRKGLFG